MAIKQVKTFFTGILILCVYLANATSGTKPASLLRGNGMQFIPNMGQIIDSEKNLRPDILYKGNGAGIDVYLRKSGISYVLSNINEVLHEVNEQVEELEETGKISEDDEMRIHDSLFAIALLKIHRVDMDFIGSNPNSTAINEELIEGGLNFYFPHCKTGITNVHEYNKITYEELYQAIDVVYYGGKEKGLKFDIVVKPGGDPKLIKLGYSGAELMRLNKNRDKLTIATSVGLLGEYMPKVYQVINDKEVIVEAKYVLTDQQRPNKNQSIASNYYLSFQLGKYNSQYPLIIDPWVTYYGGSNNDWVYRGSIATDPAGNVIFSGYTTSIDFPVSTGAFQTARAGLYNDAFLVKMTQNGNRVFATYIGGEKNGYLGGISCDANNNIFATGYTNSSDFPTKDPGGGAYFDGSFIVTSSAGVIVKFDPNGSLLWSTYFGGSSTSGNDTYVDLAGNVIVVGQTNTTDFYVLNAMQPNLKGIGDGFISKFTNAGVCLWSTFFGGSSYEEILGVATDNNNIFISGVTYSTDFPTSSGAFQSQNKGGYTDFFISKFDPSGNMLWSTYYGGSASDRGEAITVDGLGNIIVCGSTSSTDMIVSGNAFQTKYAGGNIFSDDAFVAKFDNSGNWQWASYYGGAYRSDYANGIAVDANNNIIISGDTYSTDMPVTSCAYQTVLTGTEDQFIANFSPDGTIICSGYLGHGDKNSPNNETHTMGGCIAVYDKFAYFLASSAGNYPVTQNAFQNIPGGDLDAVVSQIDMLSCDINTTTIGVSGNNSICIGSSVDFNTNTAYCNSKNYQWYFTGGTPPTSTDQNPTNITYSAPGAFDVKLVINSSFGMDSIIMTGLISVYDSLQISTAAINDTICLGDTVSLSMQVTGGSGFYNYYWNPGNLTASSITVSPSSTTTYTASVTEVNIGGCSSNATKTITVLACTGINETAMDQLLTIYPNPSNGRIVIEVVNKELTLGNSHIKIFNAVGKEIYSTSLNKQKMEIDLSSQPKGIYLLKIISDKGISAKQLIVE